VKIIKNPLFWSGTKNQVSSTYLPDTLNIPLWKGAAISYPILNYIRNKVLEGYDIKCNKKNVPNKRKIYLTRKNGRMILNNEAVETLLVKLGYEIVDPGDLSFQDQVLLFSSASEIVAPNGAALSNLIFASEGCKVLCLNSPFTVMFSMFASLAKFSKCEFLVLGGIHDEYHEGDENKLNNKISKDAFFSSYSINLEELKNALELQQ
jgi:capsular polysaccharide biosynthesis protein